MKARARLRWRSHDEADKRLIRASSANETRPEDRGKNAVRKGERQREGGREGGEAYGVGHSGIATTLTPIPG